MSNGEDVREVEQDRHEMLPAPVLTEKQMLATIDQDDVRQRSALAYRFGSLDGLEEKTRNEVLERSLLSGPDEQAENWLGKPLKITHVWGFFAPEPNPAEGEVPSLRPLTHLVLANGAVIRTWSGPIYASLMNMIMMGRTLPFNPPLEVTIMKQKTGNGYSCYVLRKPERKGK